MNLSPDARDYTLAEVSLIMRRGGDTVRKLAAAGRLPGAYQLVPGGRWQVRRGEFDAWHAGLGPASTDPYRLEPPSRRSTARRKAS